eukprot:2447659-Alexandrium_andersonii.AAC.1
MGTWTTGSGVKARSELLWMVIGIGCVGLVQSRTAAVGVCGVLWLVQERPAVMRPTPVGMRGLRVVRARVATVPFGCFVFSPRCGPRFGGSTVPGGFVAAESLSGDGEWLFREVVPVFGSME